MNLISPSFHPEKHSVYIVPPLMAQENRLFKDKGFNVTQDILEADILVFTGGQDINPALYGERPHVRTSWSNSRDKIDLSAYRTSGEKFKIGICRGGQFLNVLSGGRLWQDVDKHHQDHNIRDVLTGTEVYSTSVHHQSFRPGKGAVVVATCKQSTRKEAEKVSWFKSASKSNNNFETDYEVLFYPETRSLCIQGHPEWGASQAFVDYFHELISRYYSLPVPMHGKKLEVG